MRISPENDLRELAERGRKLVIDVLITFSYSSFFFGALYILAIETSKSVKDPQETPRVCRIQKRLPEVDE